MQSKPKTTAKKLPKTQPLSGKTASGTRPPALPMKATEKTSVKADAKAADSKNSTPPPPMRTMLSQFAAEFCSDVDPVRVPLTKLESIIGALPAGHALHFSLPDLRDVRHHIDVLLEKVREQHAYVIIFGPLKSGKSTLMNALCASYVSEVTSLPAYPSLVHISHSLKPVSKAIRYDGSTQTFEKQEDLHTAIARAHTELTAKLRETEAKGEKFDPVKHMPSAFRKIEVGLATSELAASKAELVDTPGLYSRMKFGYDQMTRDFRNTAACAIFVVKSDNLFLEQVFDEFNELLNLFSRIFLIVNLDSRKQDLGPQGELMPSLEQKDPQKIIDAFRNLAMSAPLKAAADDGRLRIYPVDLLNAASGRIRGGMSAQEKPAGTKSSETKSDVTKDVAGFEALRKDLVTYLNSNDYLKSFLSDSVRRATSLMKDVQSTLQNKDFANVKTEVADLARQKETLSRERKAIEHLWDTDWNSAASDFASGLRKDTDSLREEMRKSSEVSLKELVDQWWKSDASLAELKGKLLRPHLKQVAKRYVDQLCSHMERKAAGDSAGFKIDASLAEDLRIVKANIAAMAATVMKEIRPDSSEIPTESGLVAGAIPVKRRFLDWILFRPSRRVRHDLFGSDDDPSLPVPTAVKEKRIGAEGRQAILDQCRKDFDAMWNKRTLEMPTKAVGAYVGGVSERTNSLLGQLDTKNREAMTRTEKMLTDCQAVSREASTLFDAVGKALQSVEKAAPKKVLADSAKTRPVAEKAVSGKLLADSAKTKPGAEKTAPGKAPADPAKTKSAGTKASVPEKTPAKQPEATPSTKAKTASPEKSSSPSPFQFKNPDRPAAKQAPAKADPKEAQKNPGKNP
jgi:GTPase SAR1 family protein